MKRLTAASGFLVLGVTGALATIAVAQDSSVYKWVDAQGVPHYSDQPPMDSAAEELPIRVRKTDRTALQVRTQAKAELEATGEIREGLEADANAAADADRQKVLVQREANCKTARERVAKYSTAQRLYKPGPNGERVYLTSEELDVERADAQRAIDEWCAEE